MWKPKHSHCFTIRAPRPSGVAITRSRTLAVGTLLCVGLLGFTRLGLTQDTQPAPVADPKVVADPKTKSADQGLAEAAAKIEIPDLSDADEKTVREEWDTLRKQLEEVEIVYPAKAIDLYEQFMNGGCAQYGNVAMEVVLHVAGLYNTELRDYEAAVKTYDWGLNAYPKFPAARQVRELREIAVAKAQGREGRAPEIPAVGVKAPQLPLFAVKIDPKVVGATPPVGPTKILPIVPVLPRIAAIDNKLDAIRTVPDSGNPNQPFLAEVKINGVQDKILGTLTPVSSTLPSLATTSRPGNYGGWKIGLDRCVTALARQKSGRLWVATEDSGVWYYDEPRLVSTSTTSLTATPLSSGWKQFTAKDGLGDDSAYALAVDGQDRVWVGTLNNGVSVWNGKAWKNYGVLEGPLGERVFDIAICPTDGDVWLATNAGLTRYSQSGDRWSYITRAEGLPSDQVQAIAFEKEGNLIVGTQCEGIGFASAADNYKQFRVERGPETMPSTPTGQGLPSNLINDVLVAQDGTIYVATNMGLAWSVDSGINWSYVRGLDYAARVRGLNNGAPAGWEEKSGATLAEDYVSCLAEDQAGRLLLGHWKEGYEVLERYRGVGTSKSLLAGNNNTGIKSAQTLNVISREASGFVKAILPLPKGESLIARYGAGISQARHDWALGPNQTTVTLTGGNKPLKTSSDIQSRRETLAHTTTTSIAKFPSNAQAPTAEEIDARLRPLSNIKAVFSEGAAVYESDDWRTQGDWVGRYGREYAVLCAARAPLNHYITLDPNYQVDGAIGSHATSDDSLRHWVHWIKTDNPNTIYDPVIGYRRQAEWDDHGEAYPYEFEGPDIWIKVQVPAGTHRLSLYFFNKDGLAGDNQKRDYSVEIRKGIDADGKVIMDAKNAQNASVLAKSRVRDFWHGVYKRFIVRGASTYWVKIGRNGSLNTIVSAVMLDKIVGPRTWADSMPLNYMGRYDYNPPAWDSIDGITTADSLVQQARIWDWKIDSATVREGGITQIEGLRVLVLRYLMAQPENTTPPQLLTRWRWKSAIWNQEDRNIWNKAMPEAREAFFVLNPKAREIEW